MSSNFRLGNWTLSQELREIYDSILKRHKMSTNGTIFVNSKISKKSINLNIKKVAFAAHLKHNADC